MPPIPVRSIASSPCRDGLVQQHTARRGNSQRPHAPARAFLIRHFRHGIETCFSGLTDRFARRIHATSAAGFALKIGLFIFVHALDRFGL